MHLAQMCTNATDDRRESMRCDELFAFLVGIWRVHDVGERCDSVGCDIAQGALVRGRTPFFSKFTSGPTWTQQ